VRAVVERGGNHDDHDHFNEHDDDDAVSALGPQLALQRRSQRVLQSDVCDGAH
jgi:hypothetical protein